MWRRGTVRSERFVRSPAVAGRFYDDRPDRLLAQVERFLSDARAGIGRSLPVGQPGRRRAGTDDRAQQLAQNGQRLAQNGHRGPNPASSLAAGSAVAALIVPHAGLIYSGPVAAYAYAEIDPAQVDRVVLLGPAHYVPVGGIGLSSAESWRTPLGEIPIDRELNASLAARFDDVFPADDAHAPEHSLEVQLPFLQAVLGGRDWSLAPLIVGVDLPAEVGAVIRSVARLPRTLVVISTDLSHYRDLPTARAQDDRTIGAILGRHPAGIGADDACGRYPLRGLLTAAPDLGWHPRLLDARTSGDTAGDPDRVVGYAAFALDREAAGSDTEGGVGLSADARGALLRLARGTISEALSSGHRPRFDLDAWPPAGADPDLRAPGASFVTLHDAAGELLGCIGSLSAYRPLATDVTEHAYDAAFRDPRFPPLTTRRAEGMTISISVLTEPQPFPAAGYDDLLRRLPAGSGLVVNAPGHRATFLPAVWEQLPDPSDFLAALWRKAGLSPGAWPAGVAIETYASDEFGE